ncbi:MAG TPA: DUF1491 family protein [Rhizobiales bacterium]|nr:DUF1491 family protein [Hyphomicrobiales bacterium]
MRVTTEIFVSALIRRVFGEGGFAAVLRRGAAEAGAVFIVTRNRAGEATLYGPAPQAAYAPDSAGGRLFAPVGEKLDQQSLDERLAREQRFDSDIWVVELEPGSTALGDLVDITRP